MACCCKYWPVLDGARDIVYFFCAHAVLVPQSAVATKNAPTRVIKLIVLMVSSQRCESCEPTPLAKTGRLRIAAPRHVTQKTALASTQIAKNLQFLRRLGESNFGDCHRNFVPSVTQWHRCRPTFTARGARLLARPSQLCG